MPTIPRVGTVSLFFGSNTADSAHINYVFGMKSKPPRRISIGLLLGTARFGVG